MYHSTCILFQYDSQFKIHLIVITIHQSVNIKKILPHIVFFLVSDFLHKEKEILKVLSSSDIDNERLRNLAISPGGLLNDDIRKEVWPRLLNVNIKDIPKKPCKYCMYKSTQLSGENSLTMHDKRVVVFIYNHPTN